MNKKIFSLFSVLLLLSVLVASGCGGNDPAADPGTEGEGTPESTVVKVGMVGPLSGGAATYGQSVRNGVEIAVNEVNENNEIEGVVLELLAEDSEGDWSKAANAFSKLADQDKVNVIVGGVLSSESEAGGPIIMSAQIPTISPSSTATGLTVGILIFSATVYPMSTGLQLAEYAVTELGEQVCYSLYQ